MFEGNGIKRYLSQSHPFPWQKRGLIFEPVGLDYSHGSHPCAFHLKEDLFLIAFTRRDAQQRSHIFLSHATVSEGRVVLHGNPTLALRPGNTGCFDCDGVISVCFVAHQGQTYLYFVGWQNLPEGMWICDTGRARLDFNQLTLTKEFPGPVLGRDKSNPLFAAATAFHITEDGLWQTWYNSGIKWEKTSQGMKPIYGIHYAHSLDGIEWVCHPGLCLPFADEFEYAFGRPSVVKVDDTYFMWYAHRASRNIDSYRMGFSSSTDGRYWCRNDLLAGIDVSVSGWDSEMICYPYVFSHKGWMYMLYNGNGFGKTGFGLAVLEPS
ncbi:MAG: hypothetical protein IPN19_06540 [Elusimicrobia bacterium]|nr:hypothetical protein [Elusimicrobiota bacterium]